MGVKNFKRLLISIPKCIEFNSESKSKLILAWVWVHTQDPDPIYTFFLREKVTHSKMFKKKIKFKISFYEISN